MVLPGPYWYFLVHTGPYYALFWICGQANNLTNDSLTDILQLIGVLWHTKIWMDGNIFNNCISISVCLNSFHSLNTSDRKSCPTAPECECALWRPPGDWVRVVTGLRSGVAPHHHHPPSTHHPTLPYSPSLLSIKLDISNLCMLIYLLLPVVSLIIYSLLAFGNIFKPTND